MNIILASIASILFLGSALLVGGWFARNGAGRLMLVWPLRIVGVLTCIMGSVMLVSEPKPGMLASQLGLASGTALAMLLAGALSVGLAGYTSARAR